MTVFLHGSKRIADDFHVTSYFWVFPCVNGLLSTAKYIKEGRKSSVQLCPQLENTSSTQADWKKNNVADCAVQVQLLYIFYDAHLWLHVCMANTAVMAISHWDRRGQQLSTVLGNHFMLLNSRKAPKWFCFCLLVVVFLYKTLIVQ